MGKLVLTIPINLSKGSPTTYDTAVTRICQSCHYRT
jgi:hypothetical protein